MSAMESDVSGIENSIRTGGSEVDIVAWYCIWWRSADLLSLRDTSCFQKAKYIGEGNALQDRFHALSISIFRDRASLRESFRSMSILPRECGTRNAVYRHQVSTIMTDESEATDFVDVMSAIRWA